MTYVFESGDIQHGKQVGMLVVVSSHERKGVMKEVATSVVAVHRGQRRCSRRSPGRRHEIRKKTNYKTVQAKFVEMKGAS